MNCKVMGIVNVTPDSFSDGGQFYKPEEAIRRARNLIAEGADIVDLGAESTRPGSVPITWEEEWSRLAPVLRGLSPNQLGSVPAATRGLSPVGQGSVPISIDTYHPETAERALQAGVRLINCVYDEPVPKMMEICSKYQAELVIPATFMGTVPTESGSVPVWIDPMIGFGTTREEDLKRLGTVPELAKKGRVLVGVSRKRIVRRLSGERGVGKLLGGSIAMAVWCAAHGASMVRVHDVKETIEALAVWSALAVELSMQP